MENEEMTQDDSLEIELEEVADDTEEDTEESTEDDRGVEYWKAEALKNKAILERNKNKPKAEKKSNKQSDDFDYGEFAYLAQKGIESDDDIKFVKERMEDSGKSLRDTLNAGWFKTELAERQALASTANATPKGTSAKGTAVDSVDYWMTKPLEEVPQEMRRAVVKALEAKDTDKGKFYNS